MRISEHTKETIRQAASQAWHGYVDANGLPNHYDQQQMFTEVYKASIAKTRTAQGKYTVTYVRMLKEFMLDFPCSDMNYGVDSAGEIRSWPVKYLQNF